jgi:hypothetical protein
MAITVGLGANKKLSEIDQLKAENKKLQRELSASLAENKKLEKELEKK